MQNSSFFEESFQSIEIAECRLEDYERFKKMYNFNDKQYFIEKLTDIGYTADDVLSVLFNKDLMLTLFMNNFETLVLEQDIETKLDVDLEIEKIRKKYIDAVDCANQSIEAANESCKMMNSLRLLIESKFGFDSNNWDYESVHEMNEAIKIYNRLVEQANNDVQHSSQVRKELADVRNKKKKIFNNDLVLETS